MILRQASYICDPRNMLIEVEFPISSRYVILVLKVDNKIAKTSTYSMLRYPKKHEEYDRFVRIFCNNFLNYTEDDLYKIADEYMPALNAHRNLKKVLNRSGKLIWSRP